MPLKVFENTLLDSFADTKSGSSMDRLLSIRRRRRPPTDEIERAGLKEKEARKQAAIARGVLNGSMAGNRRAVPVTAA